MKSKRKTTEPKSVEPKSVRLSEEQVKSIINNDQAQSQLISELLERGFFPDNMESAEIWDHADTCFETALLDGVALHLQSRLLKR